MNCQPSTLSIILVIILAFVGFSSFTQSKFSAGFRFGAGGSPIPLQATLNTKNQVSNAYAGTTLIWGIRSNYIISNSIGIESGVSLVHYSYYGNNTDFWKTRIWKSSATLEVVDFQLPLLLVYRYDIPSNPFMDITFTSGTTIDWLTGEMPTTSKPIWFKNVVFSVVLGYTRMKGGRLEYGFEFQHSLRSFTFTVNNDQIDYTLHSRLGLLSLNLSYLFSIGRKDSFNNSDRL